MTSNWAARSFYGVELPLSIAGCSYDDGQNSRSHWSVFNVLARNLLIDKRRSKTDRKRYLRVTAINSQPWAKYVVLELSEWSKQNVANIFLPLHFETPPPDILS